MSQVLWHSYRLLGGIDFLKFSWVLLLLDMSLLSAIAIVKSLATATEMTCIQIEITLLCRDRHGIHWTVWFWELLTIVKYSQISYKRRKQWRYSGRHYFTERNGADANSTLICGTERTPSVAIQSGQNCIHTNPVTRIQRFHSVHTYLIAWFVCMQFCPLWIAINIVSIDNETQWWQLYTKYVTSLYPSPRW